ncbi:MAG: prenyltransferase/squalene oxidase repeat-containing protein [Planctomycetia bacterium]
MRRWIAASSVQQGAGSMSFTGPRTEAGGVAVDTDALVRGGGPGRMGSATSLAGTQGAARGVAVAPPQRPLVDRAAQERHGFESGDPLAWHGQVDGAIGATAGWLLARQARDGHWRAPLEGDTILESEYILILAWAEKLRRPEVAGAARRILAEQLPDGGWAIYPGGPVDVSASVKAYFALKLTGYDPDSEPLSRARHAIEQAGGPWAVNSFTKFYLALLGQMPYAACPAVPPEMVLLPDWFPVNLHRVSAWSRTMIVPLSLIWAFKPVRTIPAGQGIDELFASPAGRRGPARVGGSDGWARFFRGVDRVLKTCDGLGIRPIAACTRANRRTESGSESRPAAVASRHVASAINTIAVSSTSG